ncbi:MAG: ThiF family adenylyltransferase [Lachnospirales bacterium]
MKWYERTRMLLGDSGIERLKDSNIIVFGVGGVGSFVCEALARAGVGRLTLVDNDCVSLTNINRQLIALNSTIGKLKTQVMAERIRDINPECNVKCVNEFILRDNVCDVINEKFDYCIDAIDTVTAKISVIMRCNELNIPIISSMGTGNKLNPSMLEITDIYKTSVCPLAKVMRKELKDRKVKKLKVCFSKELPIKPLDTEDKKGTRPTPGSVSFVPSVAGLMIAGEVVRDICSN